MKTMLIVILLLFISIIAIAPESNNLVIITDEPLNPYERIWNATCRIESNFNSNAIGDLHLKRKSYGIVQIRKTRLDDYFIRTGIRYTEYDMFDPVISKEVFMFYALQYLPSQIEEISRCWNGGERGMQKKSTIKYYEKIKTILK